MANWLAQNESRLRKHPLLQNRGDGVAANATKAPAGAAKPIKQQTTARKGVFGEVQADDFMQRQGFVKLDKQGRLTQLDDAPAGHGIDSIGKNLNPPPDYVIAEAKYGDSGMGQTLDGRQMSDDWVSGSDRLKKSIGPSQAFDVRDSIDLGKVEKWLLRVDDTGHVRKSILDVDGYVRKSE